MLPGLLLLLIARALAERVAPGTGTATAVTVGAGTLILPFATLFYSHVLTALLVLASFALLWTEREARPRLWFLGAAGFLAGFAITSEYPAALAAVVFGLYAVLRTRPIVRAGAYAAGVAAGVAPLLLYNEWAFGSVTHLSYFGDELSRGNLAGRLDPSLINGLFTFLALPGLLVLSPLLACGLVGTGLLLKHGKRAEALAIALLLIAFTVYNASLPGVEYDAFLSGPRYLVPIVPLIALPVTLTFRRWPFTTGALALVSMILMSVMTASHVYTGARADPRWFDAIVHRAFPKTAASVVGVTGWYAILPFFAALAAAILGAAATTRGIRSSPSEQALAGFAVLTWAGVALLAPTTIDGSAATYAGYVGPVLVLLTFAATVASVRLAVQPGRYLRARARAGALSAVPPGRLPR